MNIHLILSMLLMLAANAVIAFFAWKRHKEHGKKLLCRAGLLTAAALYLLYALDHVLFRYTLCETTAMPLFSLVLVLGMVSADLLLNNRGERPLQRFLRCAVKLFCLSLALELAVFCGRCYGTNPITDTRAVSTLGAEFSTDAAVFDGNDIIVSGTADITFHLNAQEIEYVQLAVESADTFYQAECLIADDNFALDPQSVDRTWMNTSQDTITFCVAPYGTLYDVKVSFRDVNAHAPVRLSALTVSTVKPFSFSVVRFLVLAGILCLIAAIRIFEWYKITYDSRKLTHRTAAALVLLLCVGGMLAMFPFGSAKTVPYDPNVSIGPNDPYAQTFDAWQHGQVHLRSGVDPLLLELENPYDYGARDHGGVNYEWDKAFYNGKYYSYFGISPVIFVYYPMYLLTGKIPNMAMATLFFALPSMIFLFALVLTVVRKYCKRPNLLLLLCGLAAAAAASGIYLCVNSADRYFLVVTAGICFLYLFLWLGLEATMAKRQLSRCLLLAGCGLAITAAVLSRPTMALYAVLLVPPFWQFIRRKKFNVRQKFAAVASFAVPLMIGAAATMAYNAVRFDSPFEFGSAYQLTVSNTAANQVRLADFPAAMVQYFLAPVSFGGVFPFINQAFVTFANTSHFVYNTAGFGAFLFLCIPLAYLTVGAVTSKKLCKPEKRWVFRLAFLTPVVMAFLDYCLAGYVPRYLCDILSVLAVFSVAVLLEAQRHLRTVPIAGGVFSRAATVSMLLAPVFLIAVLLADGEHFTMWQTYPDLYFELRDLIVFWR